MAEPEPEAEPEPVAVSAEPDSVAWQAADIVVPAKPVPGIAEPAKPAPAALAEALPVLDPAADKPEPVAEQAVPGMEHIPEAALAVP